MNGEALGLLNIETIIIELLLIVSLVAIAVQRLRVPYTVALVAVGLLIGLAQPFAAEFGGPVQLELTPELILTLFVPPLVFEAAFNLDLEHLWRNFPAVLMLAVPGVIVTMFVVGGIVSVTTALPMSVALVFGALIAATDPVAVVAMFRTLGVPRRPSPGASVSARASWILSASLPAAWWSAWRWAGPSVG